MNDAERPHALRFAALLARAPQVVIELERLESLGLWCVTEVDDPLEHPLPPAARPEAAPVLFGVGNRELPSGALRAAPADGGPATLAALTECAADAVCALTTVTLRTAGMLASAALEVGAQIVLVADGGHLRLVREPSLRTLLLRGDAVLLGCGNPSGAAPAAAAERQEALVRALSDEAPASDADGGSVEETCDVYQVVLPMLERAVRLPRKVDEVAESLGVLAAQAKAWLAKAESEGRVRRVGRRPTTYQASAAYQPGLFDGEERS